VRAEGPELKRAVGVALHPEPATDTDVGATHPVVSYQARLFEALRAKPCRVSAALQAAIGRVYQRGKADFIGAAL